MSNFISTTADEKARCFILKNINTNIFVEAGAGSGKTTMLVNRMVAMVESGIPVDKICAITFTKNAALEFYERFQSKLIERINPKFDVPAKHAGDLNIPTEKEREKCKTALENIDLCFMGTIDSFCNMILSEHPIEAGIPSGARLISNEEAKTEYRKFFIDVRKGKYTKDLQMMAKRFSMFFWNPEDMFASLIGEIMNRRNVTFHYDDDLCIDFNECFATQIDDLRKALNRFSKDKKKICLDLKDEALDTIEEFNNFNATVQRNWEYNYKGIQIALNSLKGISYPGSCGELGFTNESVVRDSEGESRVVLNIADSDNPDALIPKLNNYKYQNTLKFLTNCIEPLEELMKREGKFVFFDYLLFLKNMLIKDSKEEGKLINYISERHSYFMIDEFQDTNPMQAEIFFYLSAKDPKKASWRECQPRDGSLFIVGDPKQSIYRFRSADVSSYISIRELFEKNNGNCAVKYLVNNFRSKNSVKTYFNDVFEEVMSDENNPEQSKYQDIENCSSPENTDEFSGIFKYVSYTGTLLLDDDSMSDSEQISKVILSIMNSDKTILDNDKNSPTYKQLRKLRFSDFMVIYFNKKGISKCIETFKKYKIPVKAEGKVLFEESDALRVITSIYKSVIATDDQISLVESLKSPVFGMNDNDLNKYKADDNDIRLDLTREYTEKGLEHCLKVLSNTAKEVYYQTPSSLFEKIIDDYKIFRYVTSNNLEVVYYALELLRNEEANGNIITFADAAAYLSNLLSGNSDKERCLSLRNDIDAVHIANLHKVKGLEAPIVILAKSGVNNKPNAGIRIEYGKDNQTGKTSTDGYVCSISDPDNPKFSAIETTSLQDKKANEINSLKYEVDRLVYVAATRARNVLIVNETMQKNGRGKISSTGKKNQWHYLLNKAGGNIFDFVIENMNSINDNPDKTDASRLYDDVILNKLKNRISYKLNKPSDVKYSPITADDSGNEETGKNSDSTFIGTIVHRMMEMIIMSKDKIGKDKIITNIINDYMTDGYLLEQSKYEKILNNVYETIHNGGYLQENGLPQNILSELKEADQIYSEVPFSYKDAEQQIWNGVIDCIYIKDNEVHIIDWKTNKNGKKLDEHYHDQLEAYILAVKQLTGLEAKDAKTYHIEINNC